MQLDDYRRLSDDGLAHVTMLEQRSSQLLDQVAKLQAALTAEVDKREELLKLRAHANQSAEEAIEAARADVIDLQTKLRTEHLRAVALFKALTACVHSMAQVNDTDLFGKWGVEFQTNASEARELLKTAAPYMT